MSDTPRTDAAVFLIRDADHDDTVEVVSPHFARQLERELAQLRQRVAELERLDALKREELVGLRRETRAVLDAAAKDSPDSAESLDAWLSRVLTERDDLRARLEAAERADVAAREAACEAIEQNSVYGSGDVGDYPTLAVVVQRLIDHLKRQAIEAERALGDGVEAEYIESGTFVASEEAVFTAGIEYGERVLIRRKRQAIDQAAGRTDVVS